MDKPRATSQVLALPRHSAELPISANQHKITATENSCREFQRIHLFFRKPCGITQRLLNIFTLQIRIGINDLTSLMPFATKLRISETVTLMPRIQARPPIIFESNVMRLNPIIILTHLHATRPNFAKTVAAIAAAQQHHANRSPCRV